jgi:hypothetical protein
VAGRGELEGELWFTGSLEGEGKEKFDARE